MNCFYHPEAVAVGICKNCQRGLCPLCAAELDNGIGCKGRCEGAVLLLNDLVQRNAQVYRKSASAYSGMGWAMLVMGIPALLIGVYAASRGNAGAATMNLIFAAGFLLISFVSFRGARQLQNKD